MRLVTNLARVSTLSVLVASAGAAADPLFESHDLQPIRIAGPLRELSRDRSTDPEDRPGTLSYADLDGTEHTFEVGLRPRGHSRRKRDVCTVPPLRVNVRKREVAGTLFDGQDKLKLVAHCRRSPRHDRYVYKEYLAYRLLNQLTDLSFRVRALDIEWVDQGRGDRSERRFGFFIEHKDRLAERLGMRLVEPDHIDYRRLAPDQSTLMELFQYLIGNTDFSFVAPPEDDTCCHNATLLMDDDGQYWPMPYDFDISGFVDPPYAVVDQQLPIANVRRRLYRGFCRDSDVHRRALEQLREARPAMVDVLRRETALDQKSRDQALAYVDAFYAILDDPEALQRQVLRACRGTSDR